MIGSQTVTEYRVPSPEQKEEPQFRFVAGVPDNAVVCARCGARQTWHYFKQVQDAAQIAERFKREHKCKLPVVSCQQEGAAA